MVMNAGRVETGKRFSFYTEGMSTCVCRVMEQMDTERLAVCKKWGYNLISEFEDALANYSLDRTKYTDLHDIFSKHPVYTKMGADSPLSVTHRYVTEDIPYLLVPLSEMGKLAGVPTPTIDSIIRIGGAMNKADYFESGRGLAKMGFGTETFEQIKSDVLQ